ncbi:MAG: 50S ribosomal protein L24 [Patescibacteria group bacterium]|nr:50S ribosomal protein L24 [Patescibacteria group bacterium]
MKFKIKDLVIVNAGADKGKTGKILKVMKSVLRGAKLMTQPKVIVEGVNVRTKHQKPRGEKTGTIIKQEAPIHSSNVTIVCPLCEKSTRINYVITDGKKLRQCKHCHKSFI